jgi:hypothetical protein
MLIGLWVGYDLFNQFGFDSPGRDTCTTSQDAEPTCHVRLVGVNLLLVLRLHLKLRDQSETLTKITRHIALNEAGNGRPAMMVQQVRRFS